MTKEAHLSGEFIMVARLLVGLLAAFYFLMGVLFWFQLDAQAANFAIGAVGELGRASIRADFGSFFLSIGIMCAYASWKRYGAAAGAAALLLGLALLGRFATLILDGVAPGAVQPMVVEAVSVAILLWARKGWSKA
jgi:hypothetical protein